MYKFYERFVKYYHEVIYIFIGVFILIINFVFVGPTLPILVPIINVIGGLIVIVPPLLIFYKEYTRKKEIEQQFIIFIRDLTDSIDSGMTLPLALEHCSKRDYLSLTPYVNELASQVNWGIPFKRALQTFTKKIGSKTITRAVNTIIEAYKVGGKISDTLNAIGTSLVTIERIKRERTASVRGQIATTYLIFFVFIFILVVLQIFLIPALTPKTEIPGIALGESVAIPTEIFTQSFIRFIFIQGFFSGLATGKMAEGSLIAGIKHSILFIIIGYTIFSLAAQFQMELF
jgi:flagellar protein FlaJ